MIDFLLHEVVGVVCKTGGLELGPAAGVFSRHLEVDDGLDAGGPELSDELHGLYLGGVGAGHGQDLLRDPVTVDAPQRHLLV